MEITTRNQSQQQTIHTDHQRHCIERGKQKRTNERMNVANKAKSNSNNNKYKTLFKQTLTISPHGKRRKNQEHSYEKPYRSGLMIARPERVLSGEVDFSTGKAM